MLGRAGQLYLTVVAGRTELPFNAAANSLPLNAVGGSDGGAVKYCWIRVPPGHVLDEFDLGYS